MRSPRVTVVLPVRNGGGLLARAISSVLTQSEPDLELIIVDNASTDDTWATISEAMARDPRVRGVRHHDVNRGAPASCNDGIELARGRWIAILDHDDWYDPDRLRILADIGECTGADLIADNQYFFDAQANVVFRTAIPESNSHAPLQLRGFLAKTLTGLPSFDYGMLKPMFRAEFVHRTGLRYLTDCPEGYDFHVLLDTFAQGGKVELVHKALYVYTVPFGRLSRRKSYATKKQYDYRQMRACTDRALEHYQSHITPAELRLLRRRSQSIAAYAQYIHTKSLLENSDWRNLLAEGLNVRIAPFVMLAFLRRMTELWWRPKLLAVRQPDHRGTPDS